MRRYLLALPLLALLFSCQAPDPFQTLSGTWKLDHYEFYDEERLYPKPEHIPSDVVLIFEDKGKRGKFDGHTVINPIRGRYSLTASGSLDIFEIDGNLQRDPDWAEILWPALAEANAYAVQPGQLIIYYREGKRAIFFTRA